MVDFDNISFQIGNKYTIANALEYIFVNAQLRETFFQEHPQVFHQFLLLFAGMMSLNHIAHLFQEIGHHKRFDNVVVAALGEQLDSHLQIGITGHKNKRNFQMMLFGVVKQIHPGFVGQINIRDHQIEILAI